MKNKKMIIVLTIAIFAVVIIVLLKLKTSSNKKIPEKEQETTKDTVVQCSEKESQTYKDVIGPLEGDYYKDIDKVFQEYINGNQEIPTGENVYDIRNYGAVNDLDILSTKAINKAIAEASKTNGTVRSEERRVGKECRIGCRSRWSPYQ